MAPEALRELIARARPFPEGGRHDANAGVEKRRHSVTPLADTRRSHPAGMTTEGTSRTGKAEEHSNSKRTFRRFPLQFPTPSSCHNGPV